MRRLYLSFLLILLSTALQAQTLFQVDTVLKNGPIADRINLVFMGDGYTAGEQGKFITDVNKILTEMFSQSPFKEYKDYFNAYAIKVISNESGAKHPKTSTDADCTFAVSTADNYFGSTFDFQGIHRLLYPTKLSVLIDVLSKHFPLYDQAFVAVNTPYYGGAGGFVATCSDHAFGRDVAMHEIGHSFAGLADEYWAGIQYAAEKPNMTKQTDPTLVKWKNWLGTSGVGIYSHSGDASWKKPHTNCKMGVLNVLLCKVCSETFVERFHVLVKPFNSFSPVDNSLTIDPEVAQDLNFSVSLVPPDPNTLKVTWEKDGTLISKNTESVTISSADIEQSATIRVVVTDTTALTRSETHTISHVYVVEWGVEKKVIAGNEIQTKSAEYELSVYPNPLEGDLKFSYRLSKPAPVIVSVMDNAGRSIKTLVNQKQSPGEYEYSIKRETLSLPSAAYILRFNFGNTVIPVKVMLR